MVMEASLEAVPPSERPTLKGGPVKRGSSLVGTLVAACAIAGALAFALAQRTPEWHLLIPDHDSEKAWVGFEKFATRRACEREARRRVAEGSTDYWEAEYRAWLAAHAQARCVESTDPEITALEEANARDLDALVERILAMTDEELVELDRAQVAKQAKLP
jgi:hypothetical protein